MRRIAASLVVIGLLIVLPIPRPRPLAAREGLGAQERNGLADALAGRRAARRPSRARGLPDVYQRAARAVPFVIAADGTGSSYVVGIQGTSALLVTNHHVVENPIRLNDDTFVLVVFYDDELAKEEFDLGRVKGCHDTASAWCRAFRGAVRRATIVASDAGQDIAVLMVRNVPAGVERLQHAPLNSVRTGEEVLAPALEAVLPELQDVGAIGDLERARRVLLHQHHREPVPSQPHDRVEHVVDEAWGEPERRLVQHHHPRAHHEGAPHREHLLLAAAQRAGELAATLAEPGKEA